MKDELLDRMARALYASQAGPVHEWDELAPSFRAQFVNDAADVLAVVRAYDSFQAKAIERAMGGPDEDFSRYYVDES